jgi:hypothetical protein
MRYTLLSLIALALLAFATTSHAAKLDSARIEQGEQVHLSLPLSISSTVYASNNYYIPSPVKGWVTGIWCVNEGAAAAQGNTPTIVVPRVGAVSLTTISATFVSGTAVGGVVSGTTALTSNNDVNKGQAIQLQPTGATTNGANARCTLQVTPNYY